MFKKIIALVLCFAFVLTFAACAKKDDKQDESKPTSSQTSSDPTQDYDKDKFDEGGDLTDKEREELEELWGEISSNLSSSDVQLQVPSGDSDSNTSGSGDGNSSVSSDSSSSTDSTTGNEIDGTRGEITSSVPSLW